MRCWWLALIVVAACRPPGYGKDDGRPDAAEATPDSGADDGGDTGDAGSDAPPALTCKHELALPGYAGASSVWLTGDFLGWPDTLAAGAVPLALGLDGRWTCTYEFAAGTHQYKFIVDGTTWIADPTNGDTVDDGFGGVNSVYTCVP